MPSLKDSLVVGIASSALFDLEESDRVFREEGRNRYAKYQEKHLDDPLKPGTAFPFVKRLLGLNQLQPALVEVIILSRNSPKSGMRVMRSIAAHELPITRSVFREGEAPFAFMPAFNMSLFLSANRDDVAAAVTAGHPAGRVLPFNSSPDDDDTSLRLAFDFDGVLGSDEAERVFQEGTLEAYFEYEKVHADEPLSPGPLTNFLAGVNRLQDAEEARAAHDGTYKKRVRVSMVTARNAPANERPIRSLESWGVRVDDAFFLGGLDKTDVLNTLKPHIFFEDQEKNLSNPALSTPAVHIPFGIHNLSPSEGDGDE